MEFWLNHYWQQSQPNWHEIIEKMGKMAIANPELKTGESDDIDLLLGLTYHQIGMVQEAIEKFSHFLQRSPDCSCVYYFRGNTFLAADDFTSAFADHQQFVDMVIGSRTKPAIFFWHPQFLKRAIDDLEKAITHYPEAAIAYFCRAVAKDTREDFYNAIADYQQAKKSSKLRRYCAAQIARARRAARKVDPKDKHLMLQGIEYCRVTREYTAPERVKVEVYEIDHYQSNFVDDQEFEAKLKSEGWKQVGQWRHVEGTMTYLQRRKSTDNQPVTAHMQKKMKQVDPEDRNLMLQGIEYCKVTQEHKDSSTVRIEVYDQEFYHGSHADISNFESKLKSEGWEQTAQQPLGKGQIVYFQRNKSQPEK